jgi:hypothetical protein
MEDGCKEDKVTSSLISNFFNSPICLFGGLKYFPSKRY